MAILENKPRSWQVWMTTTWRPLMAVTYMATIWFDFIIGPVIFNLLQYRTGEQLISSWTPLTLQGGGLYHLAMGAVLGIAAWTRGQEKVASMNGQSTTYDYNNEYIQQPTNYQPLPQNAPGWINREPTNNNANTNYQYQPPIDPFNQPVEQSYRPPIDNQVATDDPYSYPNRPLRRQRR